MASRGLPIYSHHRHVTTHSYYLELGFHGFVAFTVDTTLRKFLAVLLHVLTPYKEK